MHRYRVVLAIACFLVQYLTLGYVLSAISILPLFYQQRYGERTVSANIGAIQLAVLFMGGLPGALLNGKIGERYTMCIAGVLTVLGTLTTAFTTQAWQGVLSSGIVHGAGSALAMTAAYSMIAKYFPSHQLAMAAAMTVSSNLAEMSLPPLLDLLMVRLGFKYTFMTLALVSSLNIVCGVIFLPLAPREEQINTEETPTERKSSLMITGTKSGIYYLSQTHQKHSEKPKLDEIQRSVMDGGRGPSSKMLVRANSQLSHILLSQQVEQTGNMSDSQRPSAPSSECANTSSTGAASYPSYESVFKLLTLEGKEASLRNILTKKKVLNYLSAAVLATGGLGCLFSIFGDFVSHRFGYTAEQIGYGLTIKGVAQLITGVLFTAVAKYCLISASTVFSVGVAGMAVVSGAFPTLSSIDTFLVLMAVLGVFRALHISALYGVCLEITSPTMSVLTFMIECFADGIGSLTLPYLAVYLQVHVDINAGMYLSLSLFTAAFICMVYLNVSNLFTSKTYSSNEEQGKISMVAIDILST